MLTDPGVGEIVVVVDGWDGPTLELLERKARLDGRLKWSVLEPNQGLVRAKLHGTEQAAGSVVLHLDDDVRPHPGLGSGHLRHHVVDHRVVIGSMHVDMRIPRSVLSRVVARIYENAYESALAAYMADSEAIMTGLWAGNVSFPRSDLLEMAPKILAFTGFAHEDQHLGLVAKEHGMSAVFDPSLSADHMYVKDWSAMLKEAEAFGIAQRTLAGLHPLALPFDPDEFPEPLNPLVGRAVLASDNGPVRRAELAMIKAATWMTEAFGAHRTAERFGFVASQIARRKGRRSLSS